MALPEASDLEQVPVLREHLESMAVALAHAHMHFQAMDLADAYREGRMTVKSSKLTNELGRATFYAEGYLQDELLQSESSDE